MSVWYWPRLPGPPARRGASASANFWLAWLKRSDTDPGATGLVGLVSGVWLGAAAEGGDPNSWASASFNVGASTGSRFWVKTATYWKIGKRETLSPSM